MRKSRTKIVKKKKKQNEKLIKELLKVIPLSFLEPYKTEDILPCQKRENTLDCIYEMCEK